MKTMKIFLIASVMILSVAGTLNANESTGKVPRTKVLNISLEYAMHIPVLVSAIYQQIEPDILNYYQSTYTVDIQYRDNIIYITGTYRQWALFFKFNPNDDIK